MAIDRQINDFIRDCVADIRFCRRLIAAGQHVAENHSYMEARIADLENAWYMRHAPRFNRYGWPKTEEGSK